MNEIICCNCGHKIGLSWLGGVFVWLYKMAVNTVKEEEPVRSAKDCPLCWGDKASLADLRVIACPVAHSEGLTRADG